MERERGRPARTFFLRPPLALLSPSSAALSPRCVPSPLPGAAPPPPSLRSLAVRAAGGPDREPLSLLLLPAPVALFLRRLGGTGPGPGRGDGSVVAAEAGRSPGPQAPSPARAPRAAPRAPPCPRRPPAWSGPEASPHRTPRPSLSRCPLGALPHTPGPLARDSGGPSPPPQRAPGRSKEARRGPFEGLVEARRDGPPGLRLSPRLPRPPLSGPTRPPLARGPAILVKGVWARVRLSCRQTTGASQALPFPRFPADLGVGAAGEGLSSEACIQGHGRLIDPHL